MIANLHTSINGKESPWSEDVWRLWRTFVHEADPKFYALHGMPTRANYFTPRPYVDEYNRGSETAGFVWVAGKNGRTVYQTIIHSGKGRYDGPIK
jgi:hypothetical protein